jgi:hypothetical protein
VTIQARLTPEALDAIKARAQRWDRKRSRIDRLALVAHIEALQAELDARKTEAIELKKMLRADHVELKKETGTIVRTATFNPAIIWEKALQTGIEYERSRWHWSAGSLSRTVNGLTSRPERPANPYDEETRQ